MTRIKIKVIHGDVFHIKADVLVLKYAQATYGLDKDIETEYNKIGKNISDQLPKVGNCLVLESDGITSTKNIIFIGG